MTTTTLTVEQALQHAIAHHQAGRLAEAEQLYGAILKVDPNHASALHLLGVIAHQIGWHETAVDLILKAIALNPNEPARHANLANALHALGRFDEAVAACGAAIRLKSDYAEGYSNLGNALKSLGRFDEAVAAYGAAIRIKPLNVDARFGFAESLMATEQFEAALSEYRWILERDPLNVIAMGNYALAVRGMRRVRESLDLFDRAIFLAPSNAEIHHSRALTLLHLGQWKAGWDEYEWRWRGGMKPFKQVPDYERSRWRGEAGNDRILLVVAEQGFGDTIQFIRYVGVALARGWRVSVQVPDPLRQLMEQHFTAPWSGVIEWYSDSENPPLFDAQCYMMSLPQFAEDHCLGVVPYFADFSRRTPRSQQFRLGIVWRCDPRHPRKKKRSIAPGLLAKAIADLRIEVVSLQQGAHKQDLEMIRQFMEIDDAGPTLVDFRATAELIATLDLVVSVDTAVAHLAGAMDVPVWTLLEVVSDWRWLSDRSDTVWYRRMRLFRQNAPDDWSGVLISLRSALAAIISQRNEGRQQTLI